MFGQAGWGCSPKVGELPERVRGMHSPKRAYGMKLPRMLIPPPLRSSSYLRRTAPSGCLLPFGLLSAFGLTGWCFAPGAGFPSPDNGGTEGGDAHRQRDRKQTLLSRRRNNLFISLTATRSSLKGAAPPDCLPTACFSKGAQRSDHPEGAAPLR